MAKSTTSSSRKTRYEPTALDFDTVELQINKFAAAQEALPLRLAFSCLMLTSLFELDASEAADALTEGGNDCGVDAITIDEHSKIIRLFQFKHVTKLEKARCSFPSDAATELEAFFVDLTLRSTHLWQTCNPTLFAKMEQIWACLDSDVYRFEVYLCSNASPLDCHHYTKLDTKLRKYQRVEIIQLHLDALAQAFSRPSTEIVRRELRFVEDQIFERSDGNLRGLQCSIKAEELVRFLADPVQPDRIDQHIFRDNVRMVYGSPELGER